MPAARVAVFALITTLSASVFAAPAVPANFQAAIITRMLGYDRALKKRVGAAVVLGIIAKTSDHASGQAQLELQEAFTANQVPTVQGLPFRIVSRGFKDPADLGAWMAQENVHVLYVPVGLSKELDVIRTVCTEKHVIAVSPVREFVEQGLPIGIVLKEERPSILVNIAAAEAIGMDLDPKLLQLSQVIR